MLYVLTDDGVTVIEYLQRNGVYPHKYGLVSESFKSVAPYLSREDTVMVISKGLIDWSLLRLMNLLGEVYDCKDRVADILVYSNIELPLEYKYTLIDGDLFYGTLTDVEGKKKGKPYKSNIAEKLRGYTTEVKCVCIDEEEELEDESLFEPSKRKPLHLIRIDIREVMQNGGLKGNGHGKA